MLLALGQELREWRIQEMLWIERRTVPSLLFYADFVNCKRNASDAGIPALQQKFGVKRDFDYAASFFCYFRYAEAVSS